MLMPLRPVRVPIVPDAPVPLMVRPRNRTVRNGSLALTGILMLKPLVPLASTDPSVPLQSMVMDLVMVKVPKPPGSRQSISPLMNVFEIAPAKVLHGAVRLHGSASLPTPETKVRVAWACAGADNAKTASVVPTTANNFDWLCIFNLRLGMRFVAFGEHSGNTACRRIERTK